MKSILLFVFMLLTGCGSVAMSGEQGPPGPAGAQGEPGPAGPPGEDVVLDGDRLLARFIVGEDGSRLPTHTFIDTLYGFECKFQPAQADELRCFPDVCEATEWYTWADPACAGDRAYVEAYNGYPAVFVLSDDPNYNGTILYRAELVETVYWRGVAHNEPCHEYTDAPNVGQYYRWPALDLNSLVLGEVVP